MILNPNPIESISIMNNNIAINNLGLCTPLGNAPEQVLTRLLKADISAMQWRDDLLFNANPSLVASIDDAQLLELPASLSHFDCRNNRILNTAADQLSRAVADAAARYGSDRIGVIIGTSTSGIAQGEAALKFHQQHEHFPPGFHYSQQELGTTAEFLQKKFALSGPCYTVSTACSSSAKVFATAKRLLKANLCDMVIVGGADSLCQLTLNGFNSLESVAKGHCNPFSPQRNGINIGEGAALFTLERGEGDIMLAGIGESADAHHISAPHPQGLGAIAAIAQALADANITPEQVDYINLHGTATLKNDAMESRALLAVFNQAIPSCSSTKPLVGHTLGAAGALEAAFCYLLLSPLNTANALPPHVWDGQQDPNDPKIPLVPMPDSDEVMHRNADKLRYIMSNSFAFGGSNASVIFSRKER
jgi:3-oxoacyl-[acyl-carrier-protein] synthase I